MVKSIHASGCALGYGAIDSIYKGITDTESQQMTDFILSTYCDVDFGEAVRYYGNLETMIIAIDSNTGSEYDMKEEWVGYTDTVYETMGHLLRQKTGLTDMKAILKLPEEERRKLYRHLLRRTDFINRQIEKYLQLPNSTRRKWK